MKDLELLSFRLLIDRVVGLVKQNIRRLYLPVALPLSAVGVAAALLQVWWMKALTGLEQDQDFGVFFQVLGLLILVVLAILVVHYFVYQSLMVAALDAVAGRPVSLRRGFRVVCQPRILFTGFAVSIATFLSILMCVLPAFYVMPALTFVIPSMVEEDLRGRQAWRRSFDLVHFHPTNRFLDHPLLQTFVLLFVGFLISSVTSMIVQWPFAVIQQILIFRDAAGGGFADPNAMMNSMVWWLQVPAQVLTGLATALAWFYWTFGIALLYRELRRRREGWDLEEAIAQMTGDTGEDNPASDLPASPFVTPVEGS